MDTLDRIDLQLISLLRSNSRMPVVDLARKLRVSRATVQNRMTRLEKERVLPGYTIKLRADVEELPVRALMSLVAENKKEAIIIRSLRGHPNVRVVHHTAGRWDLIAEISADSLVSFNRIVGELRMIDGVSATETSLLLDSL
jgi:DNA-binding Lrp family transcriptional regulator